MVSLLLSLGGRIGGIYTCMWVVSVLSWESGHFPSIGVSVPMPNSNNKPQHQANPLPSLADSSQPAIGTPTGTEPLASGSAEAGGFLLLSYDPADLIGRRFLFRRLEARLEAVAELPSATWIHADGTVQYVELPEVCDGPDLIEPEPKFG